MTDEQKLRIANNAFNAAINVARLQWKEEEQDLRVPKKEMEGAGQAEVKTVTALLELILGRPPTEEELGKVNVSEW